MVGMIMIPGVECARRRRLHHSGGSMATHNSSRRSYSLYPPSNMEFLLSPSSSSSSLLPRSILNQAYPVDNEKLGGAVREAKQRLDDKFTARRKSEDNQKHKQKRKSLFSCFMPTNLILVEQSQISV